MRHSSSHPQVRPASVIWANRLCAATGSMRTVMCFPSSSASRKTIPRLSPRPLKLSTSVQVRHSVMDGDAGRFSWRRRSHRARSVSSNAVELSGMHRKRCIASPVPFFCSCSQILLPMPHFSFPHPFQLGPSHFPNIRHNCDDQFRRRHTAARCEICPVVVGQVGQLGHCNTWFCPTCPSCPSRCRSLRKLQSS